MNRFKYKLLRLIIGDEPVIFNYYVNAPKNQPCAIYEPPVGEILTSVQASKIAVLVPKRCLQS